jgi:CTP:molybdopterin cytidylyltransferase MocA
LVTIAAVVLAAGGGSRFAGTDHKLLTPLRGRPIVAWAVDAALSAALDETIVVTGVVALDDALQSVAGRVSFVQNDAWAGGIATSITAAIEHAAGAGHDAIVVGLGDQPFVGDDAWRAVARAHASSPIVVATYEGQRRNPVRLDRAVWPLLDRSGDEGARSLMRRQPELVDEVACRGIPADVDTLEDLDQWN